MPFVDLLLNARAPITDKIYEYSEIADVKMYLEILLFCIEKKYSTNKRVYPKIGVQIASDFYSFENLKWNTYRE